MYFIRNRQLEIKIMTGRMKGQAFVTFPSIESAREALVTVNGYIFKEKDLDTIKENVQNTYLEDVLY